MIKKIVILVVAGLITFTAGVAFAKNQGKLPKGAIPLSADEVKAIYVGKTMNWKPGKTYWSAEGTTIGYYPVKGDESFAEGTWSVNGNEMCYDNTWHGKDKTKPFIENTCAKFFKVKKVIWIENTKDRDKWQGDIWTGIEKKMKEGDSVSKKALEIKAKLGY